ncbi:hypothetical protein GGS20DRAFT_444391 [Poronia punctata]|nr:hypothetical protein GGS20DRAFT_444391 [Poronia punctata]
MGRQEPLTSLALGRSPYDDVVEGEGEADPHEPPREYDEHGRIVNETTKKIIKDIIRAHNEVMLVIGVAEPDNPAANNFVAEASRIHQEFENATGRNYLRLGRLLVLTGIWGVHGVRQRIMVYRDTAMLPFIDMMQREWRIHSPLKLLCAGMPSFFGAWALQCSTKASVIIRDSTCLQAAISYIRFHLQIHVVMQRLDLIPATRWLPGPSFFLPFSSSSPFQAPPPLGTSGARTLPEWAGQVALSLAPYAGYYLVNCAWDVLSYFIRRKLRRSLPHPSTNSSPNATTQASAPANPTRRQSVLESPTLGEADREIRHSQQPEMEATDSHAVDGESTGETLPLETIRRQGTFSSRGGDDYATDEEDADMVNPTLISFDVDTSESTEPPTGVWSAELRPSNSSDSRSQHKETPNYIVNALTRLPSALAEDILTGSLTHLLLMPFDIVVFRSMAWSFARKFGLSTAGMFGVARTGGLLSRTLLNVLQAEGLKFLISCEVWAVIAIAGARLHATEEDWREYRLEMEREMQQGEQAEADATGTDPSPS